MSERNYVIPPDPWEAPVPLPTPNSGAPLEAALAPPVPAPRVPWDDAPNFVVSPQSEVIPRAETAPVDHATPLRALGAAAMAFAEVTRMVPQERSALIHQLHPSEIPEPSNEPATALEKMNQAYDACLERDIAFSGVEAEVLRWLLARDMPPHQQPLPAALVGERLFAGLHREQADITATLTGVLEKLHAAATQQSFAPQTVNQAALEKAYSYLATGYVEEQETLALSDEARELAVTHTGIVPKVMATMHISRQDRDDAEGSGMLGLLQAAGSFDSAKGVSFTDFAWPRIKGAIIDWQRQYYRLNRATNEVGEPAMRRDTLRLDRPLTDESAETLGSIIPDTAGSAETVWHARAAAAAGEAELADKLGALSAVERAVVFGRADGESLNQIGQRLSITGSRVSQLHKKALAKLRDDIAA